MLSLHQELLLLAINDQGDIEFTAGTSTFRLAFVGACIITLEQDGYLECSLYKVRVIATNTAPDPTLALVLTKINESPSAQRLRYWLSALQEDFEMLMKLTLKSLCDLGVLTIEESRFFGCFHLGDTLSRTVKKRRKRNSGSLPSFLAVILHLPRTQYSLAWLELAVCLRHSSPHPRLPILKHASRKLGISIRQPARLKKPFRRSKRQLRELCWPVRIPFDRTTLAF